MIARNQRLLAEFIGTAALLTIIVGSGHMGEMLAQGNAAIALLANAIATGLGLWVLIELCAPISGAYFNPIVSAVCAYRGELPHRECALYIVAQIVGAILGVMLAHAMFDLAVLETGTKVRSGIGQLLSEIVATAGLLITIFLGRRSRPAAVPAMVAAFITSAYWFTASTAFANPAVTIARSLTATFAGIRLVDVPMFIVAQGAGAVIAVFVLSKLASASAPIDAFERPSTMER